MTVLEALLQYTVMPVAAGVLVGTLLGAPLMRRGRSEDKRRIEILEEEVRQKEADTEHERRMAQKYRAIAKKLQAQRDAYAQRLNNGG